MSQTGEGTTPNATGVVIGPTGFSELVATRYLIYAVDSTGALQQYQGVPGQWNVVGQGRTYAAGDSNVYQLAADGTLSVFTGVGWETIGNGMTSVVAGGDAVYATAADGSLLQYEGVAGGWTPIGGPFAKVVTNGARLFAMSTDFKTIYEYDPTPSEWTPIGAAARDLYVAPNALYAVAPAGGLFRWSGTPGTWIQVGSGWAEFAASGISLYAISTDGSVTGEFDGVPGAWQQFAGAATAIAATGEAVYLLTTEGAVEYDVSPPEAPSVGAEIASANETWQWSFTTSDRFFSGYDGQITLMLWWSDQFQQTLPLPMTSFKRGQTSYAKLQITDPGSTLTNVGLGAEQNYFSSDHWTVDRVTAFDPTSQLLYTFVFDCDIPDGSWISKPPASVTTVRRHPGLATVFVWNYLGKDVAYGHASIELDDETYISWWPSGVGRERMKLLPKVYTAPAIQPRTLKDDVAGEKGHQPDWQVTVAGLDHNAIRSWWSTFKSSHKWSTLSQNCSTTVADAIFAGGANRILTSREYDNFQGVAVWVPNDVLLLATTINAHNPAESATD